ILLVGTEAVLAELAVSLRVDPKRLRVAVRKGKPLAGTKNALALPAALPPPVPSAELVGSFWLSGTAIVGEWPEEGHGVLRVAVRPGAWHAYSVDESANPGLFAGLILLHADGGKRLALDAIVHPVGSVNLEGATLGVLDAAALTDEDFGADEVRRRRR